VGEKTAAAIRQVLQESPVRYQARKAWEQGL
jgi:hypothetical protein